ncbi:MAG: Calcium-translocating P-type ATPase, PMCA-type [Parcubacteria group bacterium GW2011_GWA1_42_7]|nr:MAG: Calcium-translocating P-type ATPase, PMCA-type [Parcubacteria group bacterium GW2011_GWA1_42_7]
MAAIKNGKIKMKKETYHWAPLAEIFAGLNSGREGLSAMGAAERLKQSGRNILPQEKPYSKIRLFFSQFNSPLMYILLVTVAISFALRHYSDTIFICVVLLVNTTVGFYQENKANQSLLALKKMVKVRARVLRDGNEKEIDSEELVAGDVVILKSGDKVPADGRVMESKGLKVNEASLTGESQAVDKTAGDSLSEKALLSERTNMVFMGTIVEEGRGTIIIIATGINTQIGEIVSLLKEAKARKTPLQQKISVLSKWLGAFVLLIIAIILAEGYFTGKSFIDVFMASLALAVSAIPAGLLPAITVILVLGLRRIFKQNGLVRKLAATETLGSVTIICTDKTGTLTEGKMQVSHILTGTRELMGDNISGLAKGENANGIESHILALKMATLANDAFVENPDAELKEWVIRGRLTEKALLLAGMQSGLDKKELEKQYPVLDRISFESEYKFAATYHKKTENQNTVYVIGAPEEIIARCADLDMDGKKERLGTAESNKLMAKLETLSQKGLRVLACAYGDYDARTKYDNLAELINNLSLIGFIALKDPLRLDAKESILTTKKAGIRTVIITGDHKLTAKAIAEEIGISAKDEDILEGKEMELISDEVLKEKSKYISVYARVSPRHKLRIVKALQANGEVVAMLGDGVNDAPALKAADIGVAVGSGTDVAKETADLVLLDDNFKTILKAIEQGRVVFQNIRKVFIYLVADDFSELFLFLAGMAMGLPLPLLPAQILWINLVEDGFPDIALTTEQETKGVMEEKPRDPKEPILNKSIKKWMAAIFFITGIAAFLTFFILWKTTGDLQKTRTMVFSLMCVDSLIFAFSVRSFKRTIFRRDIFSNRYLVGGVAIAAILLIGAIYFAPLQKLLATQSLPASDWLVIFAVSSIEIILIEFFKKRIFRNRGNG